MNINALLVHLSVGKFPNSRQDRQMTDEMKLRKALGKGAGRWIKFKLPIQALDPVTQFESKVRSWNYSLTLPWEEGYRLLPCTMRQQYEQACAAFQAEWNEIVSEFSRQYPWWIKQARLMHNGTFNPSDYPDWEDTKRFFRMAVEFSPVPAAGHFNTELRKLYGDALEQSNQARIEAARADLWNRLLEPVQAMADKLANPEQIFRDSLVENIRDVLKIAPDLNITGDAQTSQFIKTIQAQLAIVQADDLRQDKVLRKSVAARARQIVDQFGALGRRKFAGLA